MTVWADDGKDINDGWPIMTSAGGGTLDLVRFLAAMAISPSAAHAR